MLRAKAIVGWFGIGLLAIVAAMLWRLPTPKPAPDVTFHTISGQTIALKSLQGQPVLVTFWASDCKSCVEEMPMLSDWHRRFAAKGFKIIGVAMYYDPPNRVLDMAKAKQLPYPVALDMQAEIADAFGAVRLTPTSFLISPTGDMVFQKTGKLQPDEILPHLHRWFSVSSSNG